MISFLKFKNKNTDSTHSEKSEPVLRSRKTSDMDTENDHLIENPEVQRARHRLLGAGFLLLVAVIGLPRVFDSEPKKIKNDVVLQVVTSVTDSTSSKVEESTTKSEAEVSKSAEPKVPQSTATDSSSSETVIEQSKPSTKPDVKDSKLSKSPPQTIEDVISETKPVADSNKDADKPKSRFYIQVATFSSNDGVKKMSAKLKNLKISSYVVERKKDPDSNTLYQVRAGPFTSKEDAQAAMDKMSGLDVNPKIIEIKK
jgi:DedD protein